MKPDSVLNLQSVFFVGKAWAKNFSITIKDIYSLIVTLRYTRHWTRLATARLSRAC